MHINQDLDEGLSGDPKALHLADLRGAIRAMISNQYGIINWSKANEIGKNLVPTMAASTIIKFATGETRQPSVWTIRTLSTLVDFEAVLVPKGSKLPKGSIRLE